MKKVLLFLVSLSLGFIINNFMPSYDGNIYTFVSTLWLIYIIPVALLDLIGIIDLFDDGLDVSLMVAFISIVFGSYYYLSEGLVHWFIALFSTFFLFVRTALISIPVILVYEVIDKIKEDIWVRKNNVQFNSNYSSTSYSNNNSTTDNSGLGLTSTFFKNGGRANSLNFDKSFTDFTGIERVTEYKDSQGNYAGGSTTYNITDDISMTFYKDKDGNETSGTSFKL